MAYFKRNYIINASQNLSIKANKKSFIHEKQEKLKNIKNKRIIIFFIILYIKIKISICDNPVITIKIEKGKNSFINNNFKKYLSEIYINDINITHIDTSYDFTEDMFYS